jgi:hypothetical protein
MTWKHIAAFALSVACYAIGAFTGTIAVMAPIGTLIAGAAAGHAAQPEGKNNANP